MDLIMLDVIMPLLNGMDTARELRNDNQIVPIIFLTSSREFAVDSYEVKAFHYLIKPVDDVKLFRTLDDFVHLSDGRTIAIRELFSKCEEIFSLENGFFRCHRSYIVNMNNIEQFTKSEIITGLNSVIPISRNRYIAFKETYFNYMFE